MNKNFFKITIFFFILTTLLFGLYLENKYFFTENLFLHLDSFKLLVKNKYLLCITGFFVSYIFIVTLSLPFASFLSLLAGAIFGLVDAIIVVSFASSIGSVLSLLIARYLLQKILAEKFKENYKKINDGFMKDGLYFLFFLRMTPIIPFFLINLLFGLTKIKVRSFYFVSQIAMLPFTVLYVLAGSVIGKAANLTDVINYKIIIIFSIVGILPYCSKKILKSLNKI